MNIYSIKDCKSGRFITPFAHQNDNTAKRELKLGINSKDKKVIYAAYPEDFQLFRLGQFDEVQGKITPEEDFVCNFTDLVDNAI